MIEIELQNPVLESEDFMSCQGGMDVEKEKKASPKGHPADAPEDADALRRIGRVVTRLDKQAGRYR